MRIIRKIWLLQINGFPFCQCLQFVQLCELLSIKFKSGEIRTNSVLINCVYQFMYWCKHQYQIFILISASNSFWLLVMAVNF